MYVLLVFNVCIISIRGIRNAWHSISSKREDWIFYCIFNMVLFLMHFLVRTSAELSSATQLQWFQCKRKA